MRDELIRRVKKRVEKAASDAARKESVDLNDRPNTTRNTPRTANNAQRRGACLSFEDSDPLPYTPPEKHHHMSHSNRFHEDLTNWLSVNRNDPALHVRLLTYYLRQDY